MITDLKTELGWITECSLTKALLHRVSFYHSIILSIERKKAKTLLKFSWYFTKRWMIQKQKKFGNNISPQKECFFLSLSCYYFYAQSVSESSAVVHAQWIDRE